MIELSKSGSLKKAVQEGSVAVGTIKNKFLIRSTYDVFPSAANLIRWDVSEDDKCKECKNGKYSLLRHTLSNCELGLKGGR